MIKWKVERAIQDLTGKKAVSCDKVLSGTLRLSGDKSVQTLRIFINNTGVCPNDLVENLIVPLPN